MERIILHCDLNNFFASVTLLNNQTLVNMPVAVCGSKKERHGIVLAKNEIAKKYGVKTAEAIWQAKLKCPDLVTLPPDYPMYEEYSRKVQEIYARYTDKIEPFGIDECWLDVTGSTMLFGSGEQIANAIRRAVKKELGLTISVGVSFNKVFAKLGSDLKKPDAVTVITRQNFKEKIWGLNLSSLIFAGQHTTKKLNEAGIFTIGDLAAAQDVTLKKLLGKNGLDLKNYALGNDVSPVLDMNETRIPKSIGHSVTGENNLTTKEEAWQVILDLSEKISTQLMKQGLYASTVQLHCRDTELNVKNISKTLVSPTASATEIAKAAQEILVENYSWELPLRSIGVRVVNLKNTVTGVQQNVFEDSALEIKKERVENSIFLIREKYGSNSLKRATVIEKSKKK